MQYKPKPETQHSHNRRNINLTRTAARTYPVFTARIVGKPMRTLAKSKSSTQGLAAHGSEAEGDVAEVAYVEAAGVALDDGPRVVSDPEHAAMTPSATNPLSPSWGH